VRGGWGGGGGGRGWVLWGFGRGSRGWVGGGGEYLCLVSVVFCQVEVSASNDHSARGVHQGSCV